MGCLKLTYGYDEKPTFLKVCERSENELLFGVDWYDFGWRMQDPQLGVWHCVDPMAEKYYSLSPYNYVFNNPINVVDPDGRDPLMDRWLQSQYYRGMPLPVRDGPGGGGGYTYDYINECYRNSEGHVVGDLEVQQNYITPNGANLPSSKLNKVDASIANNIIEMAIAIELGLDVGIQWGCDVFTPYIVVINQETGLPMESNFGSCTSMTPAEYIQFQDVLSSYKNNAQSNGGNFPGMPPPDGRPDYSELTKAGQTAHILNAIRHSMKYGDGTVNIHKIFKNFNHHASPSSEGFSSGHVVLDFGSKSLTIYLDFPIYANSRTGYYNPVIDFSGGTTVSRTINGKEWTFMKNSSYQWGTCSNDFDYLYNWLGY